MSIGHNEKHLMIVVETDNLTTENITDINNIQGQDFEGKFDMNISINDITQDIETSIRCKNLVIDIK